MPARNAVFTDSRLSKYKKPKKNAYTHRKQLTRTREIPEKREKRGYRKYLIGVCIALAIIIAILLAGLLPALIVNAIKSSTSNTATNVNSTGVSSGGNRNGTNTTSVTSAPSGSSTTNSASTTIPASSITSMYMSSYGFTAGGTVLSSTTAWYGYEEVTVSCSVDLIDITIVITVQKTVNATYYGAFSTFWAGTVNQTYTDTGSEIIYIWTIVSNQIIQASGSPYTAQAQFKLYGVNQITSADTYNVTATTTTGLTNSVSGTF